MQSKEHWDRVYSTKRAEGVSWYQQHPQESLKLVRETGVALNAPIIDVGGGASTLVDDLLAEGNSDLTVLDLSSAALAAARARLGVERSARVRWLEANIMETTLPVHAYEVWHDRAVFHFLTLDWERVRYVEAVIRSVKPGGHVIVATFAEDGPTHCSGLSVVRYRADELHAQFGESFALLRQERELHRTPSGTVQPFVYCYCRKLPS